MTQSETPRFVLLSSIVVTVAFRSVAGLAWFAGVVIAIPRVEGASPAVPAATAPTTAAALLAGLSPWSQSVSAYGGFGYSDNVVLSHTGEERSGFAHAGFDALLLHAPRGNMDDYSFYVSGDGRHYFSSETVDHEVEALTVTEWRSQPWEPLKFSLDLKGYYSDTISDVSETEAKRLVAELKLRGANVGPTLRWKVLPWLWVEGQGIGQREKFADGFSDSRLGAGTLRALWHPSEHFEVIAAGTERSRDYDHRLQLSTSGRELDGTHLKVGEREGELRINAKWDGNGRWKTVTRFGTIHYTDNGSGYFNYRVRSVKSDVNFEAGNWKLQASGAARRLDFEVQSVGLGVFPPLRVKEVFAARVRLERKLSERWSVYAEYHWERSRCNDPIASYIVNEGLLGAQWSWEK